MDDLSLGRHRLWPTVRLSRSYQPHSSFPLKSQRSENFSLAKLPAGLLEYRAAGSNSWTARPESPRTNRGTRRGVQTTVSPVWHRRGPVVINCGIRAPDVRHLGEIDFTYERMCGDEHSRTPADASIQTFILV
jgi:hypothetical protein